MSTTTKKHNEHIESMTFSSVYPHYITKVEKKGRTIEELHQVIEWLTGFDAKKLHQLIDEKITFKTFFEKATLHKNAHLIKGVICGYRIEDIDNELTQKVRYLDKIIDELARGRKMEKILRTN
jgi:hypothetical protein